MARPTHHLAALLSAVALAALTIAGPAVAATVDPAALDPATIPAADPAAVPVSAKLTACTTGLDALARTATFSASMPAIKGSTHLWIRFQLAQRRGSTGAFVVITVPGWGVWEKSGSGRSGFVFTKRVDALLAPAAYRAQVTLRWLGARRRVLRTVTKTTATCQEPDLRPDLTLAGVIGHATGAKSAIYTVTVADDGASGASAFAVALASGALAVGTQDAGPLAPGAQETVSITGPACASGTQLSITLDSGHVIDEADESDDVVSRPCPLN